MGHVVRAALRAITRRGADGEVVVVDDGSSDGTGAAVRAIGDPRVRVIRHGVSRGYGAALRTGFGHARGGLVFFTDADAQFDVAEVARLESWVPRFDLVVGYRAPRRDGWYRRAVGWGWSRLLNATLGVGVRDVDCAFKLVRRQALLDLGLVSRGAFVNGELLVRARARGLSVKEVPVTHFPRPAGVASGARLRVGARAVRELCQLVPELRRLGAPSTGEGD